MLYIGEMHEDELLKNRQSACMASATPQPCIKNASSLQIPSSISGTIELTAICYYRFHRALHQVSQRLFCSFSRSFTDNCENFIEL